MSRLTIFYGHGHGLAGIGGTSSRRTSLQMIAKTMKGDEQRQTYHFQQQPHNKPVDNALRVVRNSTGFRSFTGGARISERGQKRVLICTIMGICVSTAEACISATDDVVNSFLDGQSRYNNESNLAKEHLGQHNTASGKGKTNHINNVLQSGLSPIYPSLPKSAMKHHCRNVYDGDTLTLDDGTRVRFLGIDTPELKENQAFSLEAKEYSKKYCHEKDVWLTFEESGGKSNEMNKDHYGRMLAFVWVPLYENLKSNPSQWLCVNEGLIASGLAHAYSPSKTKKVNNHDKLLGLQRLARVRKSGQWKTFKDYNVTISPNGSAFHKCKNKKSTTNDCKHLARSKSLSVILASEAYDKGMHPCRNCLG